MLFVDGGHVQEMLSESEAAGHAASGPVGQTKLRPT